LRVLPWADLRRLCARNRHRPAVLRLPLQRPALTARRVRVAAAGMGRVM